MTQSSVKNATRPGARSASNGTTMSVRARADDVAAVLAELSTLLLDDSGTETLLQRVVDAAIRTIVGCDAASVSLMSDGATRTAVFTEPAALAVDQAQYDLGDGPCLEAYRTGTITQVDLGEAVRRWPRLTEAATASGLCSFLAAPLNAGDEQAPVYWNAGSTLRNGTVLQDVWSDERAEVQGGRVVGGHVPARSGRVWVAAQPTSESL